MFEVKYFFCFRSSFLGFSSFFQQLVCLVAFWGLLGSIGGGG